MSNFYYSIINAQRVFESDFLLYSFATLSNSGSSLMQGELPSSHKKWLLLLVNSKIEVTLDNQTKQRKFEI